MIYLDSAATSLLKPAAVPRAVSRAIRTLASPGRGGHAPAMEAAKAVYDCRCAAAELFDVPEPERVVFTMNATHGLNIAIRSLVRPGDRVVISGYEHNSVTRALKAVGADIRIARSPLFNGPATVAAFRERLAGASAAVCTHVSNVFGFVLPIYEIAALCRAYGVPLIVDASQSAGCADVDFRALDPAFIAMPGHKGLLGPQGTGLLLCGQVGVPLLYGGTGSDSKRQEMPDFLPDRLEAGTHNVAGIAGLREGIRYVLDRTPQRIGAHERDLTALAAGELEDVPGLEIFNGPEQAGVLSVRHTALDCETLCARLGERGVAVRGGLHCAPTAHETVGTLDTGTVRLSFSPFSTRAETVKACRILRRAAGGDFS
ncbi:MAG TPA: aminotransferase class V-fold PLP-dependent enzyme [Oscillospiraceae bacterium]|nr:aminotransferase class V-fold PLP-dependent enzyme [Oscillospiraceae bacterium]